MMLTNLLEISKKKKNYTLCGNASHGQTENNAAISNYVILYGVIFVIYLLVTYYNDYNVLLFLPEKKLFIQIYELHWKIVSDERIPRTCILFKEKSRRMLWTILCYWKRCSILWANYSEDENKTEHPTDSVLEMIY